MTRHQEDKHLKPARYFWSWTSPTNILKSRPVPLVDHEEHLLGVLRAIPEPDVEKDEDLVKDAWH